MDVTSLDDSSADLGAGAKTTVTLALMPTDDLPLGQYTGTLALTGSNTGITMSFDFRAISDAVGDVQVNVQDEYTYYVAGAPLVANAHVALRDPFDNSVVVAEGTTDASGSVLLPAVREGNYLLEVQADRHATYRAPFTVVAGPTNDKDVFIQRQTVTYTWTVTPTEIEDHYDVALETTFETNVPLPVVTITAPTTLPDLSIGESAQIMVTIANHGLIAVENGVLSFSERPQATLSPRSSQNSGHFLVRVKSVCR